MLSELLIILFQRKKTIKRNSDIKKNNPWCLARYLKLEVIYDFGIWKTGYYDRQNYEEKSSLRYF